MSKKKNDWKDREGVVYSTQSDFNYQHTGDEVAETLPPQKQNLKVGLDTSGRAGKQVTLIAGFVGSSDDLEKLAKMLKGGCGVGGSAKDGNILIQGDMREKVVKLLVDKGYKTRR